MTKTTIKTVIFDFDGTIADTLSTIVRLFNSHANEFGYPKVGKSELERLRGKTIGEIIKEFKVSLIKLPFIGFKIRKELNKHIQEVKLFRGIRRLILGLKEKKLRLGILSSNSRENIEKFLKVNDLTIFEFIHSEINIFGKEKAFRNLLNKYKLNPREVIYIGDEVRDIEACRSNGVKIISVTWGVNKKDVLQKNKPDYLVNQPEEILKIIVD